MTAPEAKDTLLVMVFCAGVVALFLLAGAWATGRGWWTALVMTAFAAWFAIGYVRARRRRRDGPSAQP